MRFYCGFVIIALVSCSLSWITCSYVKLGIWLSLFINAAISFIIPNIIFLSVYGKNKLFRESVSQIIGVIVSKKKNVDCSREEQY